MFCTIGSANNGADHFTKALPLRAHRDRCCDLMVLHFIMPHHYADVVVHAVTAKS
jgi:hypothetical protein